MSYELIDSYVYKVNSFSNSFRKSEPDYRPTVKDVRGWIANPIGNHPTEAKLKKAFISYV